MSELMKDTLNNPKKARLGRGLGSLLGENSTAESEPVNTLNTHVSTQVLPTQQLNKEPEEAPLSVENSIKIFKSDVGSQNFLDTQRVWNMDIQKVRPNAQQPRRHFDKTLLEELAQSIREKGILQPITVRRAGSYFEIVAGERRWRAAQLASLHEVPVIIRDFNDQDTLELALIENIQRADLNAIEEAKAYQVLADRFQLTQAEIAQKVGKDRSTVTNCLRLLSLAPAVQEMVSQGQISMGHARALLTIEDGQEQLSCAKLIVQKGLSVRQAEKLAKGQSAEVETDESKTPQENLALQMTQKIEDDLQKLLSTKVDIEYRQGKGKISLHFHSDDEFNGIVDIIRMTWQK